jgi:hypothetical protein
VFLEIRPKALKHQCWSDFRISQRFGDVVAGLQPLCWEYQWITRGYSALSESYNSELLSRVRWGCPQVRFNLDPGPSSSASKATGGETIWGQACCGFMRPFPASGSNVSWDILSAYMLGVPGRTCLDGFQSFLYTHFYFFTMFDLRCSTGSWIQLNLISIFMWSHEYPWIHFEIYIN